MTHRGTSSRAATVATLAVVLYGPPAVRAQADTVPPSAAAEVEYAFSSGDIRLAGTLTLPSIPASPVPVVVIVAGSGPADRNGNQGAQMRPNSYAQLAWALAERGVASVRYDKRVLPSTDGFVDVTTMTMDDLAGDVMSVVRSLASDDRFSHVVVLGHSQGAALAIRGARRGMPAAALILAAGQGRAMNVLLREQLSRQLDSATLAVFDSAFARYLRGDPMGDVPGPLMPLLAPVNRTFMRSLVAYDPAVELHEVTLPVLIVQGGHDIQIRMADAEALHGARPDAEIVFLPTMSHVLKHAADTLLGSQLAGYTQAEVPIAPEVVDAVVAFVRALP